MKNPLNWEPPYPPRLSDSPSLVPSFSLFNFFVAFSFHDCFVPPLFSSRKWLVHVLPSFETYKEKKRETTERKEKYALFNYWAWPFILSLGTTNYLRWFQTGISVHTCQWSTTLTTLAENWRKTSHEDLAKIYISNKEISLKSFSLKEGENTSFKLL